MELKSKVPKSLRGPVGLASICIMLLGVAVGYIFIMFGISIYFELIPQLKGEMSSVDALVVVATGVVSLLIGYSGWRGFTYFSY